jgi:two-component system secretion response regulator SsrB
MEHQCVLLADSHVNILEGVRGLLETEFETVVMVSEQHSLFETIERLKPDLAVVDLSLPVSSGNNIVRQIKQQFPDLPVIILSVHDEQTVVNEVMTAGAAGFVLKRSVASDLLPAVDTVFNGHTYTSHDVGGRVGEVGEETPHLLPRPHVRQ